MSRPLQPSFAFSTRRFPCLAGPCPPLKSPVPLCCIRLWHMDEYMLGLDARMCGIRSFEHGKQWHSGCCRRAGACRILNRGVPDPCMQKLRVAWPKVMGRMGVSPGREKKNPSRFVSCFDSRRVPGCPAYVPSSSARVLTGPFASTSTVTRLPCALICIFRQSRRRMASLPRWPARGLFDIMVSRQAKK